MEECYFFNNKRYRLFGHMYRPDNIEKENGCGIVICDPFAEEKLWSQRVMVNFARLHGATAIVLETTSTWTDAIAFYQCYGFRITHAAEGDTHCILADLHHTPGSRR